MCNKNLEDVHASSLYRWRCRRHAGQKAGSGASLRSVIDEVMETCFLGLEEISMKRWEARQDLGQVFKKVVSSFCNNILLHNNNSVDFTS